MYFFEFLDIKNPDINPDPDLPKSLDADPYPDSVNPESNRGLKNDDNKKLRMECPNF
jgi:hypothetical protein